MTRPWFWLGLVFWGLATGRLALADESPTDTRADELPSPGRPIERLLDDREAHRYALPPDRSDLWIVVDQRGIDVELVAATASGQSPIESLVNSPGERWGAEWLRLASQDPATVLEIRAAAPGSGPGRYRLMVEARGEPSDLRRDIAERAVTAAAQRYPEWTREAWSAAEEHYARALGHWQAIGADAEAARTLFLKGLLLRQLDELDRASAMLRQALDRWRDLGDRRGQALALMELANTARWRGAHDEAEPLCREALDLWNAIGDIHGQATTSNYLGLILARDDPRAAVGPYRQALDRFRALGDTVQEGVVLNNLGGTHHLLGEPHEALDYFQRAAEIHERRDDLLQQAIAWSNIASVHRRIGRLHDAIDGYHRSLDARRQLEDVRGEGRVLNNLGMAWLRLGDAERAEDVLRQALLRRRESGDRRGLAVTLHNLGTVHEAQEAWGEMLDVALQALAARRALGDRVGEATSLRNIGRATSRLGRVSEARQHFADAAAILDQAGATWLRASVSWRLGELLIESGEAADAVEALGHALALYRQTGDTLSAAEVLVELARAERAVGRSESAFAHVVAALGLLESVRAEVDHLGLRSSFYSDHGDAFELAIGLAMDLHRLEPEAGWPARAFELSERTRARSLVDRLEEAGAGLRRGVEPALLDRQRRLVERLNANVVIHRRALRRSRAGEPGSAAGHAAEIVELRSQLEAVETEIRRQSPAWASVARPRPLDLASVQALLDDDTLLIEYALGEERSIAWVVDRQHIESVELADRKTIAAAARAAHEGWRTHDPRARQTDAAAAAHLADLVLGPIRHRLTAGLRLAVVADGALHYVPFVALPNPLDGRPWLVDHEVVALPSASALAVQRRVATGSSAPRPLAVIADPIYTVDDPRLVDGESIDKSDDKPGPTLGTLQPAYRDRAAGALELARLPWSAWEAERIAGHAGPEARVWLGPAATLDAVRGDPLRDYRIVHFATHGIVDSERPELSALVLSLRDAAGGEREGFLRLPDIANLDLDAELVVLSGCRTALGPEIRGEGLVGLSRGFFAAGARRVVASLWRVQDRSAAELMDRFYRRLLDPDRPTTPAAALRQAQIELRAEPDFADPYHWAAFAVIGDWR